MINNVALPGGFVAFDAFSAAKRPENAMVPNEPAKYLLVALHLCTARVVLWELFNHQRTGEIADAGQSRTARRRGEADCTCARGDPRGGGAARRSDGGGAPARHGRGSYGRPAARPRAARHPRPGLARDLC